MQKVVSDNYKNNSAKNQNTSDDYKNTIEE